MAKLCENKERLEQYRAKAKELVSKMTLEEKVSQMLHEAPAIPRLGIAEYNWWNEALHGVARAGVATMFPQAIGMAAAFDEDMMEVVGDAIATEGRAKFNMQKKYGDADIYKGLTFWAPNINIFRDPRWGRGHETYGEDPYLTTRLGVRFVDGLQGKDEKYLKSAACAKHFAVHSGPEEIRHSFDAVASKKDMYETYLPAFKALVKDAHVEAVMGAYNRTNGKPCCGNEDLLQDLLRDTWGFDGHVVSDCWAIKDFHEGHKVTDTPIDSVSMAVNHGCDVNCGNLFIHLIEAVEEGKVKEETIDQAVERLMMARIKLGTIGEVTDDPYAGISYNVVDSKEMKALNLEVAEKSIVLLKNDSQALPLDITKLKTVGVIGPNANSRAALQGNYVGTASRYITALEGIQDYVGDQVRVLYSQGCHLYQDRVEPLAHINDRLAEVKAVCDESDVVIACLGLDADLEGEEGDAGNAYASGDKPNLNLPGLQQQILEAAYQSGKPVILLLLAGSALDVSWADEHVAAIVQCWYPGALGGKAIARVLFGDANPQGKLPVTFYRGLDGLPEFTDYSMKGRTYRYMEQKALYPFGFGLSYTSYSYDFVQLSQSVITEQGITIRATVKNTGARAGICTTQVYVKALQADTPNA
ncbi:MAG TPA: glycoside hydrolase family 3 C-terminal domain-containing protein, partial [Lachnospiraceae bacterium]|nr:glycoside hydrolase family 3 C-terminal domain-containing protein [Lachnospiraceae bacterium]